MKTIEEISDYVIQGKIELSRHALAKMLERNISQNELQETFTQAEIIENYPNDRYLPSCLIVGTTFRQRPIHVVITGEERKDGSLFIITLYEPDAKQWHSDWKTRK